jgi:hypothetical protein
VNEMSETRFTAGPWVPGHFANRDHKCDCRYILSEQYHGSIAIISVNNGKLVSDGGNDAPPLEEARANAHLIAAAPELFEAAQAAERKIVGAYIEKTAADADPVVIALRAALSKANPPEK